MFGTVCCIGTWARKETDMDSTCDTLLSPSSLSPSLTLSFTTQFLSACVSVSLSPSPSLSFSLPPHFSPHFYTYCDLCAVPFF